MLSYFTLASKYHLTDEYTLDISFTAMTMYDSLENAFKWIMQLPQKIPKPPAREHHFLVELSDGDYVDVQLAKNYVKVLKNSYLWTYHGKEPEAYLTTVLTGIYGDKRFCMKTHDGVMRRCFNYLQVTDGRSRGNSADFIKYLLLINESQTPDDEPKSQSKNSAQFFFSNGDEL